MVTVQFREPTEAGDDTVVVAELTVDDAGQVHVSGDRNLAAFAVPVIDPDSGERLTVADDPARWARHLPGALRSGYLTAVVTRDDQAGAQ